MKTYHAFIVALALLAGCSGSGSDSTPLAENIYANGYRLAKVTSTLNFSSNNSKSTIDYAYNFSSNEITVTRFSPGEDNEPSISKLKIDRSGRLIGGSYDYSLGTFISGTTEYAIRYDAAGKVIEHAESQFDMFTFNYTDKLLDNIVHRLSSSVYTHKFTYDAQGRRTSSLDGVVSVTTHYDYNLAGQISSANEIDQFGEQLFSYEFAYDLNGNHISTLAYTARGELFSTDVYTYEVSAEPIFNHGIMRQAIEPFEATNGTYVR